MYSKAAAVAFHHVVFSGNVFADEALCVVPLLLDGVGGDCIHVNGGLGRVCCGAEDALTEAIELARLVEQAAPAANGTCGWRVQEARGQVDVDGVTQ